MSETNSQAIERVAVAEIARLNAELTRLRALNAELQSALDGIFAHIQPDGNGVAIKNCVSGAAALQKARTALAKAKEAA